MVGRWCSLEWENIWTGISKSIYAGKFIFNIVASGWCLFGAVGSQPIHEEIK